MGQQKGVFQIHGSLGNLRNYKTTGSDYITTALKGGPSKAQVETLPSMDGCRRRNNEWKGCMKLSFYIRSILQAWPSKYYDRFLTGRINKICQELSTRDFEGVVGQRALIVSGERPYTSSLVLNTAHPLRSALNSVAIRTLTWEHDITRLEIQVSIPYVKAVDTFDFRGNETCVRMIQLIGSVSDFYYEEANRRYEPLDSNYPYLNQVKVSPWVAKTAVAGTELKIEDTLGPLGFTPGDSDTVFQIVCIEYGFGSTGSEYPSNHFGIGIIDLF